MTPSPTPSLDGEAGEASQQICNCPCCQKGIEAPHEYHLERRLMTGDAKARGMAIYQRAKETAMELAALAAYNAHFFKCTPSCSVADWTTAWKKAVMWWIEPVNRAAIPALPPELTAASLAKAAGTKTLPILQALNRGGGDFTFNQPLTLEDIGRALAALPPDTGKQAVQFQRRRGIGDGSGGFKWCEWQVCTEQDARRIASLRSWQWRKIVMPAASQPAPTPDAAPVAVRYRNDGGRWRYLNYPFTKGWDFPPNLGTPRYLYEGPTPVAASMQDTSSPQSPQGDLTLKCLPHGVMFDAFGRQRVRYVRVIHDGTTCVVPPGDVAAMVDSERPSDYRTEDVYLSKEEFDALPEFNGF